MAGLPNGQRSRRVTLVADELLGYTRTGGIGTATTFLALALARLGHEVELLYTGGERPELASDWAEKYTAAGVRVRVLRRTPRHVEPAYFGRLLDVEAALTEKPPDVVVTQDLAAPAYTALRMRTLGLGLERTLFVVYCHGGRRWITDTARKVRVLPGAHAITLLEQASVELADVVVSPSQYLLDWMRAEGWRLPDQAFVIPYVNRTAALGERAPEATAASSAPVERIAFFGRLEDRKGIRPFAAGVNALEPELLRRIELDFVGRETPAWPRDRIEELFSERTRKAVRGISFATDLDQPDAIARLRRPGTLAVMPSYGETFSNAVFECLEHGIPFLASNVGAPKEFIAPADHPRVLFEPTPEGVATALRRALANGSAPEPARSAFDPQSAVDRWSEVVQLEPRREAIPAAGSGETEFVLLADDDAVVDESALETLKRAQAVSGADVVTCGIRLPVGVERVFIGDAGGLGLLANHYGTVALVRRSLLRDEPMRWQPEHDARWPLLARLALDGANIVSIPRALARQQREPGDVDRAAADALLVVDEFERRLPASARSLARLTAGLAANAQSTPAKRRPRVWRRWRR